MLKLLQVEAKQSFDREPEQQHVNPGEDAVIPCRIFDKHRNSICNWQKDGLPIRIQNGKYEWEGNRAAGDCSLRILKADINFDNGKKQSYLWAILKLVNIISQNFLIPHRTSPL